MARRSDMIMNCKNALPNVGACSINRQLIELLYRSDKTIELIQPDRWSRIKNDKNLVLLKKWVLKALTSAGLWPASSESKLIYSTMAGSLKRGAKWEEWDDIPFTAAYNWTHEERLKETIPLTRTGFGKPGTPGSFFRARFSVLVLLAEIQFLRFGPSGPGFDSQHSPKTFQGKNCRCCWG